MFSSPISSPTNRSPLPHPFHSNWCHPERSEGSAFRLPPLCALSFLDVSFFNFKLSTVNFPSLSPFLATLTDDRQLTKNPATLSPFAATLTGFVNHNPFVCHSCKKHPGWGAAIVNFFVTQTSVCALLRQSTSEASEAKDPQELKNLALRPIASCESPLTAPALLLPPVTSHQSQITNPFTIRTYEKLSPNPFRIPTSKTRDLKSFRMNTYEKTLGRATPPSQLLLFPLFYCRLTQARPKRATNGSEDSLPFRGHGSRVPAPRIHESPITSHGISPCYTPARLRQ